MKKKLYKGTFNLNGQNMIFYRYAYTDAEARTLFIHAIEDKYKLGLGLIMSAFDGSKDNYRIEKVKPVKL